MNFDFCFVNFILIFLFQPHFLYLLSITVDHQRQKTILLYLIRSPSSAFQKNKQLWMNGTVQYSLVDRLSFRPKCGDLPKVVHDMVDWAEITLSFAVLNSFSEIVLLFLNWNEF